MNRPMKKPSLYPHTNRNENQSQNSIKYCKGIRYPHPFRIMNIRKLYPFHAHILSERHDILMELTTHAPQTVLGRKFSTVKLVQGINYD